MATYVTIDTGTTNTRLYLVKDKVICDVLKLSVGARNGAQALRAQIRDGIAELLSRNEISSGEVRRILSSGMSTSEYGLYCIPHLLLPIDLRGLHENRKEVMLPDVSDIPFCFVPGVKSVGESIDDCDSVRGEETEIMGLLDESESPEGVYVLPGSHSKHMTVDGDGRIVFSRGTLTGELFRAIVENTMLRGATDFDHAVLIEESLIDGYECCERCGFNVSISKVGTMNKLWGASREICYSFLLGAVLHDEVRSLLRDAKDKRILLGGQAQLRRAIECLLRHGGHRDTHMFSDERIAASTALGVIRIFEYGEEGAE